MVHRVKLTNLTSNDDEEEEEEENKDASYL